MEFIMPRINKSLPYPYDNAFSGLEAQSRMCSQKSESVNCRKNEEVRCNVCAEKTDVRNESVTECRRSVPIILIIILLLLFQSN